MVSPGHLKAPTGTGLGESLFLFSKIFVVSGLDFLEKRALRPKCLGLSECIPLSS